MRMADSYYSTAFKLLTPSYSVIPSGGGDKHKAPLVNWQEFQRRKREAGWRGLGIARRFRLPRLPY